MENNSNFLLQKQNMGELKICPFCSERNNVKSKPLNTVYLMVYFQCKECERYFYITSINKGIKNVYFKRDDEIKESQYNLLLQEQGKLF